MQSFIRREFFAGLRQRMGQERDVKLRLISYRSRWLHRYDVGLF